MSLEQLSPQDLKAIADNNFDAISVEGLRIIAGIEANGSAPDAPQPKRETAGFPERMVRGAVEFGILGPAQTMSRPLSLAGEALKSATGGQYGDFLSELPERWDQIVSQYGSESEQMAPEGMDWGRMLGGALPYAAGGVASAAKSLPGLIGSGMVSGGSAGLMAPVTSGDYSSTKGMQTVGGAVLGGVAAPVANTVLSGVNNAIRSLAQKFRNRPVDPAAVQAEIVGALQSGGLDYQSLSQETKRVIQEQVQRALKENAPVNREAIANAAALETLGIKGTKGQITRSPTQYAREEFLRQTDDDLAAQYAGALSQLNARMAGLQDETARPITTPALGEMVRSGLERFDETLTGKIDELYQIARNQPDAVLPVDMKQMARNVYSELKQNDAWESLPSALQKRLSGMARMENPEQMTVRGAVDWLKSINSNFGKLSGAEGNAIRRLKANIDDAISAVESQAGADYMKARRAARNRFDLQEVIPALKSVADGDFNPDRFMQKFVYSGRREELDRLRKLLKGNAPDIWNQIRGQVLYDIRKGAKAVDEGATWSQAGFARQFDTLADTGKLSILFTPDEIATLRAIRRAGKAIQEKPAGVISTGLGGAAQSIDIIQKLLPSLADTRLGVAVNLVSRPLTTGYEARVATGTPEFAGRNLVEFLSDDLRRQLSAASAPASAAMLGAEMQ